MHDEGAWGERLDQPIIMLLLLTRVLPTCWSGKARVWDHFFVGGQTRRCPENIFVGSRIHGCKDYEGELGAQHPHTSPPAL